MRTIFGEDFVDLVFHSMKKEEVSFGIGIPDGLCGVSLFYLYYSSFRPEEKYTRFVNELVDMIYMRVEEYQSAVGVTFSKKFVEIGCTLSILLEKKIVSGNPDQVLKDIDVQLFRSFFKEGNNGTPFFDEYFIAIVYFFLRLRGGLKSPFVRPVYESLFLKLIDDSYEKILQQEIVEPLPFSVLNYQVPLYLLILSEIYHSGMYRERISHILNEYMSLVFSHVPLLHSNRLFMLSTMYYMQEKVGIDCTEYISILKQNISLERIINTELDNMPFLFNGRTGAYLLMKYCNDSAKERIFDIDLQEILSRISSEPIWQKLDRDNNYVFFVTNIGLEGFLGLALADTYIKKQIRE